MYTSQQPQTGYATPQPYPQQQPMMAQPGMVQPMYQQPGMMPPPQPMDPAMMQQQQMAMQFNHEQNQEIYNQQQQGIGGYMHAPPQQYEQTPGLQFEQSPNPQGAVIIGGNMDANVVNGEGDAMGGGMGNAYIQPMNGAVPMNTSKLPRSADGVNHPAKVNCPNCGQDTVTKISMRPGMGSIGCCIIIGIIFFPLMWVPFCIPSLNDKVHKCGNCNHQVGKTSAC